MGSFGAGLFCEDDALRGGIEQAATRAGERVWRLPLWREHREFMRWQHADILNSNAKREAHPIQGAAFLSFFVDETVPWAHIDIAGPAYPAKAKYYNPTKGTGHGLRLLVDFLEGRSS